MVEVVNARGPVELQRMVRCNEALRVLLRLHDVALTRSNCTCAISTSKPRRITGGSAECDSEDSLEPLDATDQRNEKYQRLIAAIKLLKEDRDEERQRAAQHRSSRVCADVLRFFLFLFGMCAVVAVYS